MTQTLCIFHPWCCAKRTSWNVIHKTWSNLKFHSIIFLSYRLSPPVGQFFVPACTLIFSSVAIVTVLPFAFPGWDKNWQSTGDIPRWWNPWPPEPSRRISSLLDRVVLLLVAPISSWAPRRVAFPAHRGTTLAVLVLPAAVVHAPAAFHVGVDVNLAAAVSFLASCVACFNLALS